MSSLISCVAWVKRGVAAQHPTKYNLDEKELNRVSALARIELEDVRVELERAHEAAKSMGSELEVDDVNGNSDQEGDEWVDEDENAMDQDNPMNAVEKDDLSQYNLDDYDEQSKSIATGPFSNIKGLTFYKDNDDDPYITFKEDDEELEREELEILPSDNLLVAARTDDDISQLEVYIYDESLENLYVHHDIMLPSFPLCLEWLDFPPLQSDDGSTAANNPMQKFGNYIAVGTFDPEIEIWSLDTLEALYPDLILGRPDKTAAHVPKPAGTGKKKKNRTKHREKSAHHHVDAVLSLSWNRSHRNLLLSASADRTVKLWDLSRDPTGDENSGALRSFDIHKDKVQAVKWNEKEPTVLLTGSYDRTVRTFDSRAPEAGVGSIVGADVEAISWDPWESYGFYVSLENGIVLNFDARTLPSDPYSSASPARFTLAAHDGAASSLDVNPHIKGCLATGGTDKMVKIWNVTDRESDGKREVSLAISRNLEVGKVFSVAFSPDDPLTLAAAGSKAKLQIWDVGANAGARKVFASKLAAAGREVKEKASGGVISIVDDDEDESGDDDGEI